MAFIHGKLNNKPTKQNKYTMETLRNMTLREIYLSWVNDFITPAGFASYYGIEEPDAFKLINLSILFGKID